MGPSRASLKKNRRRKNEPLCSTDARSLHPKDNKTFFYVSRSTDRIPIGVVQVLQFLRVHYDVNVGNCPVPKAKGQASERVSAYVCRNSGPTVHQAQAVGEISRESL